MKDLLERTREELAGWPQEANTGKLGRTDREALRY